MSKTSSERQQSHKEIQRPGNGGKHRSLPCCVPALHICVVDSDLRCLCSHLERTAVCLIRTKIRLRVFTSAQKMAMSVQSRALGAVIGAAVADAAAQPMHWIYNLDRLREVLADLEPTPEFRADSANPFYRRKTGEQTCYGDQAYVLLESLSQCGGVNVEDLTQRFYKFFGPETVYDLPVNDPYRKEGGPKAVLPIDGPWRHASIKVFLKNVDSGKEETGCDKDCQMDGITKLAPVVAFYAGRPEMLDQVEKVTRVTQNNDLCVAVTLAAARFLEHFILNGPSSKALEAVLAQLRDPQRQNPQELDNAIIAQLNEVKKNLAKPTQQLIPALFTNT